MPSPAVWARHNPPQLPCDPTQLDFGEMARTPARILQPAHLPSPLTLLIFIRNFFQISSYCNAFVLIIPPNWCLIAALFA